MSRINRELIDRLKSTLRLEQAAVYKRVERLAHETMLERPLAALLLASRSGINIYKFSTPREREQIRQYLGGSSSQIGGEAPTVVIASQVAQRPSRKSNRANGKQSKNSVFVVHGRNDLLRRSMFDFLRALGLRPMEWSHAVASTRGPNPYIGEILDAAMAKVQAVVVLLSPDDLVQLKPEFCGKNEKRAEGNIQGQARPNVLFEAGLALGRYPNKTLLVQVGRIKPFSDIAGKHIVRLGNESAKRNEVANRLQKIGCTVDRTGNDWMSHGDFAV